MHFTAQLLFYGNALQIFSLEFFFIFCQEIENMFKIPPNRSFDFFNHNFTVNQSSQNSSQSAVEMLNNI